MSRIVVTGPTCALVPIRIPIYPRARFTTRSRSYRDCYLNSHNSYLNRIHCAETSSLVPSAPYYRIRHCPLPSVLISAASHTPRYPQQTLRTLRNIRTMPDPVQRTASPYTDPAVKGPRSQQLTSGLARSRLQDDKSKLPPNKPCFVLLLHVLLS
jgi:hypothetical protein